MLELVCVVSSVRVVSSTEADVAAGLLMGSKEREEGGRRVRDGGGKKQEEKEEGRRSGWDGGTS